MGANDRINCYPPRQAVTEEERVKLRLQDRVQKIWRARRDEVAAGDEVALRNLENDLLTHFADTGELRLLLRVLFTNSSDFTGRELMRIVKGMILADAEVQARADLQPPSRRPLGASTVAALDAVALAAADL